MKFPFNQKGLTLPELLLSLALFSIVLVLAGSLLSQSVFINQNMGATAELREQGNVILASVRELVEEGSVLVCTEDPHTLTVNENTIWTKDQLLIQELYIESMESSSPTLEHPHISKGTITGERCVKTSKELPTYFRITLTSVETGKEFTVASIIRKRPIRETIEK
jgi:prepilin-type N-terminal cleavage/methylation domain-containing protein